MPAVSTRTSWKLGVELCSRNQPGGGASTCKTVVNFH